MAARCPPFDGIARSAQTRIETSRPRPAYGRWVRNSGISKAVRLIEELSPADDDNSLDRVVETISFSLRRRGSLSQRYLAVAFSRASPSTVNLARKFAESIQRSRLCAMHGLTSRALNYSLSGQGFSGI